jgi:hypothetical protein
MKKIPNNHNKLKRRHNSSSCNGVSPFAKLMASPTTFSLKNFLLQEFSQEIVLFFSLPFTPSMFSSKMESIIM